MDSQPITSSVTSGSVPAVLELLSNNFSESSSSSRHLLTLLMSRTSDYGRYHCCSKGQKYTNLVDLCGQTYPSLFPQHIQVLRGSVLVWPLISAQLSVHAITSGANIALSTYYLGNFLNIFRIIPNWHEHAAITYLPPKIHVIPKQGTQLVKSIIVIENVFIEHTVYFFLGNHPIPSNGSSVQNHSLYSTCSMCRNNIMTLCYLSGVRLVSVTHMWNICVGF